MDHSQIVQALSSEQDKPHCLEGFSPHSTPGQRLCGENGPVVGNAQDVKQEWDAFQRRFLPNVYLKSTDSLNQRRKSELNQFSVPGASN